MKKWKVFSAAVLSAAMLAAPMTAMADDAYRVCFVARASADTFAAWLTNEMKKAADQYDDIELTCVSGEADDAEMAKQLEDCITKQYDYVIVQSNNNAAQAPYVKAIADAGIPVVTTNPTTHQADLDGETGDPEPVGETIRRVLPTVRRLWSSFSSLFCRRKMYSCSLTFC